MAHPVKQSTSRNSTGLHNLMGCDCQVITNLRCLTTSFTLCPKMAQTNYSKYI